MENTVYEACYDLFSWPDIIWVIKSRWMRWEGNAACIRQMQNDTWFCSENLHEGARI
jgi:hypothetical protein